MRTALAAEAREVFDVSGAGDTVVAVLAAALGAGAPLRDAARLANVAAGIVVGKVGTAVVHASRADRGADRPRRARATRKVLPLALALDHVARWRRNGLKVGFTNGCFDLLHPGHVALLGQARARRATGSWSGSTATPRWRGSKGPSRPVQNEQARAAVLASLASVDLVVLFEEDTPVALITRAQARSILVKGADYRLDQVVGADVVQSYGGKVLLARSAARPQHDRDHRAPGALSRAGQPLSGSSMAGSSSRRSRPAPSRAKRSIMARRRAGASDTAVASRKIAAPNGSAMMRPHSSGMSSVGNPAGTAK